MQREYVMLATTQKDTAGIRNDMLWSIKYDGMRAFWLPTAIGLPVHQVPFCHDPEPDRICTGLFSRYGKVIHAPESFREHMPRFPVDGELFTERNDFQRLISICRAHNGDWSPVKFMVFDAPRYNDLFTDGRINNNIVKNKHIIQCDNHHLVGTNFRNDNPDFLSKYLTLMSSGIWNDVVHPVYQHEMRAADVVKFLDEELALGGEGVIGRTKDSTWVPKRSKSVVKVKPSTDDEAVIVDHTPGEGKYKGMLGAYVVYWKNKKFQLSGMTDYDRHHPLARGTTITFRYRTLTEDGYPREARFVREFIVL